MLRTNLTRVVLTASMALLLTAAGIAGKGTVNAGVAPRQNATQAQPDCQSMTDADIARKIDELLQADELLRDQVNHIIPSVRNRRVILFGYAESNDPDRRNLARRRAKEIADAAPCVRRVESRLDVRLVGGCGLNEKPCGGICIPRDEPCARNTN